MVEKIRNAGQMAEYLHSFQDRRSLEDAAEEVADTLAPEWRGRAHGWVYISMLTRQVLRRAVGEITRPLP